MKQVVNFFRPSILPKSVPIYTEVILFEAIVLEYDLPSSCTRTLESPCLPSSASNEASYISTHVIRMYPLSCIPYINIYTYMSVYVVAF